MSLTPRERNEPTKEEQIELLEMLMAAVEDGQLVALAFMLHNADTGASIVDYRGTHEMAEITGRTVCERIAVDVHPSNPEIAAAIRRGMANAALLRLKAH